MASRSTYAYPDTDDEITVRFIDQAEPFTGYWDSSDRLAMERTADHLTGLLGPRADTRALDVGCGPGRLLPWLARLAGRVTATDPDPGRLAEARHRATELSGTCEITVTDTPITELGGEPFDLVLCSHVIQHIPTTALEPLLRRLHERTTPGGYLVLLYTRAPFGEDRFSIDRVENGRVSSHPVDRERFDAMSTAGATGAGLPIHHRDPVRFARLGESMGWSEKWTWSYHVMDDLGTLDAHVDRDVAVNGSPELRRNLGRDMVAVWRRRP